MSVVSLIQYKLKKEGKDRHWFGHFPRNFIFFLKDKAPFETIHTLPPFFFLIPHDEQVRYFLCTFLGGDLMSVKVKLDDAAMLAELEEIAAKSETAMRRTMSDIKKRGPTWIAKGVTKDYNLTTAQVKDLSKLKVTGDTLGELSFNYTGRLLTPSHFKMSPTAPKPGAYTIKATIKRGKRVTVGRVKKLTKKQRKNIGRNFQRKGTRNSPTSPPMLVGTGNKREGGTSHIPFQRTTQPGNYDKAIRTLSVPQMIQDRQGNTKPAVRQSLSENIEKRFNHHTDQIMR